MIGIVTQRLGSFPSYAMTNLVCCFPKESKEAGTNEPAHDEIVSCVERLEEFISICKPKMLVCVGSLADEYLLANRVALGVHHLKFCSITHPAAIIRATVAAQTMMLQKAVVVLQTYISNFHLQKV